MIARSWHGRTRERDYDAYWAFLKVRAVPDYRAVPGCRGVRLMRRREGDVAHFLVVSWWDSYDAIRAFAGEDAERAKYYPEDDGFLLEFEPTVTHWEATEGDEPRPGFTRIETDPVHGAG